jgi:hypothetical protein
MIVRTTLAITALFGIALSIQSPTPTPEPATSTVRSTTTSTTLVSPAVMDQWRLVAQCETHQNWRFEGANWDGGLGISRTNWEFYGGRDFAPAPHFATPEEQVVIARRIQARAGVPDFVPDQDGTCRGW